MLVSSQTTCKEANGTAGSNWILAFLLGRPIQLSLQPILLRVSLGMEPPSSSFIMTTGLQCPRPARPSLKRILDLDCIDLPYPSTTRPIKRCQLEPTPPLTPSVSSSSKQRSPAVAQPALKRERANGAGPDCISSKRRCLEQSPTSLTWSVHRWLSDVPSLESSCLEIPRPNTAPPPPITSVRRWRPEVPCSGIHRSESAPPPFRDGVNVSAPVFELPEVEMSQPHVPRLALIASTSNTRPSVSDPLYRETIHRNGIILDPTGMAIAEEEEIREMLETDIFKGRDSPPLSEEEVKQVVRKAADLLDNAEGKAGDLIDTKAFPLEQPGSIAEGRNVQWNTDALPINPRYAHQLAAPKPDHHCGYPLGRKFDWTDEEMAVIDHRMARPYTQPRPERISSRSWRSS